ncbi:MULTISPECIES: LysR family transcriptional regulator [unclassified Mesorhizobium]|uniref:LysR family transcriptional regulator n=1 Tax=unclassified Mesorhizobium TaxID=325217 RepID=UPI000FCBB140|nr:MULTISPECIES: LysR family transcriptional regulator [unclassified Mesorhizobium]TIT80410.1 MAG: LysR family transcriptional regulator [Mesorhizobium sp.]TGP22950.1 LysR family transcriptional regulator [Mesorhizobium sp. M1D.F.Ca.ET.231.01.1.1]TGP32012.1 LysR family transcriptional regulator [Mesorhizobium sp. M1D.F.Ca.ET.234.01.1.1]TGS46475.1 LysR family transcriptional regulator [Mesorhizobium sp. M1D.F.Ca.ET.184.01.1.1]TGS61302.1 LysR family transcriptional regulator [Mesorhizobium sp. M
MKGGIDLRMLEIAAVAIESGSMSAAGSRLGLTQSAVSQAVRRLEKEIGAKLLHRERRPLTPTDAGSVLAAQVQEVVQRVGRAVDAVRSAAAMPERLDLRLGLVDSFAGTIGAYLVKELVDGALALRLTAWSGLAYSHTEALMRHAIDAAVTSDPMEGLDDIMRYPLFREPYLLLVPKNLGADCRDQDLREILSRRHLIRLSARSHSGSQIERHLRRLGLEPPRMLEFDTSDALVAMVATGVGVAITTPLCLLQGAAFVDGVEVMPLPGPGFSRQLTFVTRREEFVTLGPRVAELARNIVRLKALPRFLKLAPWLEPRMEWMMLSPDGNP